MYFSLYVYVCVQGRQIEEAKSVKDIDENDDNKRFEANRKLKAESAKLKGLFRN